MSMRLWDTPVPIPNTMVKTQAADGTLLETVRESRWMPESWGFSSVGRAPALQAGGHEFESRNLHEVFLNAQPERRDRRMYSSWTGETDVCEGFRDRGSRRLSRLKEDLREGKLEKRKTGHGSYAATKFERTSLSGQVTAFTRDASAMQTYQVFTVMYLENYILKMIRHQTVDLLEKIHTTNKNTFLTIK